MLQEQELLTQCCRLILLQKQTNELMKNEVQLMVTRGGELGTGGN